MPRCEGIPGVGRRLLSLVYELLLLTAVILLAAGGATALAHGIAVAHPRALTQLFVTGACLGYFVWQWHGRGQTLPMKTWKIRIETAEGRRVPVARGLLRAILSVPGYSLFGISVLWALVDRENQFLHDRLAGTRLVIAG
ncbi:MAG: RDD family protein [Burkholderiales bacterium]|nr:RDD family protein [Burkholderiales bacterium]